MTLCQTLFNYLTTFCRMTFAHEVGHNFGAEHSFEDGQGMTGTMLSCLALVFSSNRIVLTNVCFDPMPAGLKPIHV
jgi:hypothetical protein